MKITIETIQNKLMLFSSTILFLFTRNIATIY